MELRELLSSCISMLFKLIIKDTNMRFYNWDKTMVQFWKSRKYNNLETNGLSQSYYSLIFEFYLNH